MGKSKNETHKQHYVPRFYLNYFGEETRKKGNDKLISFYQFDNNLFKENIIVTSICYEKDFYGADGNREKWFSGKEAEWDTVIKKVQNGGEKQISDSQENKLKEFLVLQYGRTLGEFEHNKEAMRYIVGALLTMRFPEIDTRILSKEVDNYIENKSDVDDLITQIEELVNTVTDLKLRIFNNDTSIPFIASDTPVVLTNMYCQTGGGFSTIGAVCFVPLSTKHMMVIYDDKMYPKTKDLKDVINDEEIVDAFNSYQFVCADNRLIGDGEEINRLLENKKLFDLRKKIKVNNTPEALKDSRGIIIASRSSSVNNIFNLKLFTPDVKLKKVPLQCREPYIRADFIKNREWIQKRIISIDGIIESVEKSENGVRFTKYERKQIKRGYEVMLKFIDRYKN